MSGFYSENVRDLHWFPFPGSQVPEFLHFCAHLLTFLSYLLRKQLLAGRVGKYLRKQIVRGSNGGVMGGGAGGRSVGCVGGGDGWWW